MMTRAVDRVENQGHRLLHKGPIYGEIINSKRVREGVREGAKRGFEQAPVGTVLDQHRGLDRG
jgi:hypothetical protein